MGRRHSQHFAGGRVSELLLGWAACGAMLGCGKLAGLDDYAVGEPRVDNPCDELSVPHGDQCRAVGVSECGPVMRSDGNGGCIPNISPDSCVDGKYSYPGQTECVRLTGCSALNADPAIGTYVVRAGARSGDGSDARPFGSIGEALASVGSQAGPLTLFLDTGEFHESVRIDRPLRLQGLCPEATTIVGDELGPTVALSVQAAGSIVSNLSITGRGPGILVDGANVEIRNVRVHDVGGEGVVVQDDAGPVSDTILRSILIERATESGIRTYGATLRLDHVVVRDTRPLADGRAGYGISVHPSALIRDVTKPGESTRSNLTVERSVIERARAAGIAVEGSHATIRNSVVRDVMPDRHGHGRGIVVESRYLGPVPAELTLERTVVERTADIGISVQNARATLDSVTARDPGATLDPARRPGLEYCLGNGIRIRWNQPRAVDADPGVVIKNSLVEGAREAGIHVEGAWARIEGALVRGTKLDECSGKFGNAIVAYSYPRFAPGRVDVVATRLEQSVGAALASFGAPFEADGVVGDCNAQGFVTVEPAPAAKAGGICGCGGTYHACSTSEQPLESSLIGFADKGSGGGSRVYPYGCVGGWDEDYNGGRGALQEVRAWYLDHDDRTTIATNEVGCFEPSPAPKSAPFRNAFVRADYMPGIAHWQSGPVDPAAGLRGILGGYGNMGAIPVYTGKAVDTRQGLITLLQVCEWPDDPAAAGETPLECFGRGAEGIRAEIVDLGPLPNQPLYFAPGNIGDLSQGSTTLAGAAAFFGVPPGTHRVRLYRADGAKLTCTAERDGDGWALAWPTESENEFEFTVEPGWSGLAVRAYCRGPVPSR